MSRPLSSPEWLLTQLPGISPEDSLKLAESGLHTTADLLQHAQTLAKQRQLAARLQMPDRWVRKWVALAELSQIPSIGCQYCGLLLHGGVTSVAQLATLSTHTLHRQILRLQVTAIQRRDHCPHPGIVSQWIQEAQRTVQAKTKMTGS
jgi:predicted flap endonuclease-1-like 5' DNA nuclease